ncbi:MAG: hypothetical protein FRX48_08480 [Lasallia pustulata]|uniref:Smr domain-containing protein n=1 Tax=Lasallia pustulata TaxID=136370 RepID=A0A5M8PFX8_9LECA|nr:MAG: hypothetical protein FRX48_08480 [Lasallia pustulata]
MSYPMTSLGSRAVGHTQGGNAEAEYDRLRGLARQEHDKRSSCLDRAHNAYGRGDGAAAHELSEEAKRHAQLMDQYNKQASDYIFRENNAVGRVDGDTIDLHGQFVEEAEDILEQRIKYARSNGQKHLHVIVGKGIHSANHVQKLKPRVEQVCQELGLQFAMEENAGRIYVDLTGGPAHMPSHYSQHGAPYQQQQQQQQYGQQPQYGQQQYQGGPQYQQGGYPGQQQQYGGGGQHQNDPNAEIEAAVKKYLPRIIRKLEGCCIIM